MKLDCTCAEDVVGPAGMRKAAPVQRPAGPVAGEGGTFALRCGPLSVSAQVSGASACVFVCLYVC